MDMISRGLRERRANAPWLAGLAWLIVAILGVPFSAVFVVSVIFAPLALFAGALFVAIPLAFVSGMWGWGSVITALVAAAYSLVPAVGLMLDTSVPLGVLVAIPGLLSALAARELRARNLERSRQPASRFAS